MSGVLASLAGWWIQIGWIGVDLFFEHAPGRLQLVEPLRCVRNLSVELGMDDDQVALLSFWSTVISAACMVVGGWLSDRVERESVYLAGIGIMLAAVAALLVGSASVPTASRSARTACTWAAVRRR